MKKKPVTVTVRQQSSMYPTGKSNTPQMERVNTHVSDFISFALFREVAGLNERKDIYA
jgi:hypothetical protein